MKQLKNVPAIRFKDNKIDWNNVKLGTFSKFRRGSFPQPYGLKKWYGGDGAKPFVQVVDVTKNLNLVGKTKQTISVLAQTKSILACKGKIVVTLQGSIGRVAILQYDAYVDRTLLIFEDFQNETNEYFWAYSIQNIFEIEKTKAPGAIIKTITKEALSSFLISIPNLPEQTQIGNFFKTLDEQISLQEQKHQKLINLKKAMLEKMFPKEGADVPEIRFKGFTDKWEVKKLGVVINIGSGSRVHKNEWTDKGVPFFRSSDVVSSFTNKNNTKAFISFKLYNELILKSGKLNKGDLLVTGGGTIGIPYIINSDEPIYSKDADLLWFKVDNKINSYYLYNFLCSEIFKNYIKKISHIGTISHYTIEQAKNTPIIIPSLSEQQKIGDYFENLDQLIQQSQAQLDKFKNIKQALLQKMFV